MNTKAELKAQLAEVHASAVASLTLDKPSLNLGDGFGVLLQMPRFLTKSSTYLETRIAICVMLRSRPTQTMKCVVALRTLREEQGAPEKFEDFWAKVAANLGDVQLTWHGYKTETFAGTSQKPVLDDLADLFGKLEAFGARAFLNSGTLLGLVRDERLIDHDDDIDIAVILNAKSCTEVGTEWRDLRAALKDAGLLDNSEPNVDRRIIKLQSCGGFSVDAFPCWFEADRVFLYPHTYGELNISQVLPFAACKVTGLPIPKDAEAMLAVNYGPGWKVPDPHYVFPHRQQSLTFGELKQSILAAEERAAVS